MKVVLVEDDELLGRHYKRVLEKAGYSVRHIDHASGAIDLIDDMNPEVILMDMLLTGSTAMVLLHELRSHDDLAKIPVVMVTHLTPDIDLETLRPYGVKRLLDKATMHPEDLITAIKAVTL